MADKIRARNVTPIIQIIRNFLLGRKHYVEKSALRYAPLLSSRTQPQPILPDGEAHKLSSNYYYARDGRREVKPPEVIITNHKLKQISDGVTSTSKEVGSVKKKIVTPGNHWQWD